MKRKAGVITLSLLVVCIIASGFAYLFLNAKPSDTMTKNSSQSAPPNVADTKAWTETFSDDFNGTSLDASKWSTCYDWRLPTISGCTNGGNNEQEWYLPSQVTVKNGVATLTAIKDPITVTTPTSTATYAYRSGMISTGRQDTDSPVKWSATYGYFVARVKFDGGQGVWPAFWLLPANRSWPPEIDIMEFLGNEPDQVLLTSHWSTPEGTQKNSSTVTGSNFTNGWHTYAVNWQPGVIDWYIDGVLKKSVTGPTVPDTPMEMIFDLAIGGDLPGNANASTPFPRSMQIDYAKVYERKL